MACVKDLKKKGRETADKSSPFLLSFSQKLSFYFCSLKLQFLYLRKKIEAKDREKMRLLILNNCSLLVFPPLVF